MQIKRQNVLINIGLAIVFLLFPIFGFILKSLNTIPLTKIFYSRLFCWGLFVFLYGYARTIEKKSFLIWKQKSYDVEFYLISILTLYFLIYVSSIVSLAISKGVNLDPIFYQNKWLYMFSILTAGFTEELIVRGYLIPRLNILFENRYFSVIVSALIFSSLHLGYHSLFYVIFTFLCGIICGVFYQQYKNIHILILFHLLWNFFAFLAH